MKWMDRLSAETNTHKHPGYQAGGSFCTWGNTAFQFHENFSAAEYLNGSRNNISSYINMSMDVLGPHRDQVAGY
jgi:hypothetical protein